MFVFFGGSIWREYEIVENHREKEDQEGNNSAKIETLTYHVLATYRDSYSDNDDYDPYDDDMYENHDMSEHLQSICDDLDITFPENSFEVLKLPKNSVEVLKILENKLESMKILENKLESLKLQENQPVDGFVDTILAEIPLPLPTDTQKLHMAPSSP
ncbi:hypothetical protein Tco_0960186 [Tanacetum coccineum]